jgi:CubicO group peptidase (beta-lactamase class C family)
MRNTESHPNLTRPSPLVRTPARHALWACLLLFLVSACLFDGDLKHDTGVVPEQLDDGWQTDTPENVGLSSSVLAGIHRELLREDRYRGALSFLVVKSGRLVFETYLRTRADQSQFRHVQSVTKSVTSLLFGIARDQGKLDSLELTTGTLFPNDVAGLEAKKASITLNNLLTMRSGIAFDNDDFSVEMWVGKPDAPIRYILEQPFYADPGEKYYYRDCDPQLVGYALTDLVGLTERELADRTLFGTLGIRNYYWEAGRDGVSMAAHGLHVVPRDLAKLGLLMLQGGLWHGERVVSEEWLSLATTAHVDSDVEYAGGMLGYGYYFWIVPGIGFATWGHGGQFVLVVPEQDLVPNAVNLGVGTKTAPSVNE